MKERTTSGDRRNRVRIFALNVFVFIFMIHGILYFLTPDEIHNPDNPIKYIKYVALFGIFIFALGFHNIGHIIQIALVSATLYVFNIFAMGYNAGIEAIYSYLIPLSLFFTYYKFKNLIHLRSLFSITYLLAAVMAYAEVFLLGGHFDRYASLGYRSISIFINPNNFGIMVVILTSYFLLQSETSRTAKSSLIRAFIFLNSSAMVILSGSVTATLILFFVFLFSLIANFDNSSVSRLKVKRRIPISGILILLLASAVLAFLYLSIYSQTQVEGDLLRSGSLNISLGARVEYLDYFFDRASRSPVFPWAQDFQNGDNIYLHIWGSFGLWVLIFFIAIYIIAIFRCFQKHLYSHLSLLLIFLIAGVSTNVFYLWPLAYIYWCVMSDVYFGTKLNGHKLPRRIHSASYASH